MTDTLKEARRSAVKAVDSLDGWLTTGEAMTLFDLAAAATGPIVEIGCWQGRSTAALALGSMAGSQYPVYAIDDFEGVPPLNRPTAHGLQPGWDSSSADKLRTNLDSVGVNGLVQIIPKKSADAAAEVGECSLLFIDGDHSYPGVSRDLELYLPKLRDGGYVALHDCISREPTVVKAVDDYLFTKPEEWRVSKRVDSAIVFQKRKTVRQQVLIGFPGKQMCYGTAKGLLQATFGGHDINIDQSGLGWDDMNKLWVQAINAAIRGEITHFAMLHSDICPAPGWLDILVNELEDLGGDLIATVNAMKDHRGLTSCGIGDPTNHWAPLRRFTTREIMELPETFSIADTPHRASYLLHNTGCWLADMRKPIWRTVDVNGELKACFAFPIRGRLLPSGEFLHERESEDWYFSRRIAELGAKTFATRKVETSHIGDKGFANCLGWGSYKEGDEETADKWRPKCLL